MLSLEAGQRRGWSGWSPVSVGGGSGLAKRRRRLGKEGLPSFGQKTKGVTERGMKEVSVGHDSCFGQAKREALAGFGRV
ncbi:hypothetical protein POTOM_053294 [Populus tomentosa]|uniref:Uncharacterized protein n=1 Tax=Populus tomentosa TaxID=118781 RepID=A0A8X7XXV9_POPTO|nr:hypothetical protein POTOM_053294 [Populus tomentosa]